MRMKKGRLCRALLSVFILAGLVCTSLPPVRGGVYEELPEVDIQAKAAILVYAGTGEILYAHNINIRREPASITKLLTCLLAIELGNLDDMVTVEEGDFFDITEDGSTAGLRPGDNLSLRDLLYCAMLSSANEACNIIARHIAGSAGEFVELMNRRLESLGCENSYFSNTHGLPDPNHYSTAYDLSLLAAACLENKTLLDIAKTATYSLPPTSEDSEGRLLTTTNQLLLNSTKYFYASAQGLKTGSTSAAGYCLAAYAKRKGDDRVLISVVLGASREEDGTIRSFIETRALLEWGFTNFVVKTLLPRNTVVEGIPVRLGVDKDMLYLVTETALEGLVPSTLNTEDLTLTPSLLYPDGVEAPIVRGAPMGTLTVAYQGRKLGVVNLIANEGVEKNSGEEIVENIEKMWTKPWLRTMLMVFAALVALYIVLVLVLNGMKRRKRRPPGNYRGKRRRRF